MHSGAPKVQRRIFTAIAGLGMGVLSSMPALAWENTCSHPTIFDSSLSLLNNTPSSGTDFYYEFQIYVSTIETGTTIEDNPKFVVVNHFYDPTTTMRLHDGSSFDNGVIQEFSAGGPYLSQAQVVLDNLLSPLPAPNVLAYSPMYQQSTALVRGDWWWKQAVADYRSGNKTQAYSELGRAMHLLTQDLTQPGHTHNDPHVPPVSWAMFIQQKIPILASLTGSDRSPIEISAEADCVSRDPTFAQTAATPPQGTIQQIHNIPELDIAESAARASYANATFLSGAQAFESPTDGIGGTIMIGGYAAPITAEPATHSEPSWSCLAQPHYETPAVNPDDQLAPHNPVLCYDPTKPYAGTFSSGFSNDWWNIHPNPKVVTPGLATDNSLFWDPNPGQNEFYFHFYNQVYHDSAQQTTLNSYLQTLQLSLSASYSAALLQSFGQQVIGIQPNSSVFHPSIKVQAADVNGDVIYTGETTTVDTVYVTAYAQGSPTDSGIGYLAIDSLQMVNGQLVAQPGSNTINFPPSGDLPTTAIQTFSGLVDGMYQIHAVDGVGNHSYSTFTVMSNSNAMGPGSGPGSNGPGSNGPGPGPGPGTQAGNPLCPNVATCFPQGAGAIAGLFPPYGGGPIYRTPGDPNSMAGPNGPVTPGQLMTYSIQFENVGDGTALGVYVADVINSALDETTLTLTQMNRVVYSTSEVAVSQSPTSFQWAYSPNTRTVTVLAGNVAPSAGGSFVLQARLRSTVAPGTIIPNQAIVYFPNAAQQQTPTNTIVSVVPQATQLSYVGVSSATDLSTATLSAILMAGTTVLGQQTINFGLSGSGQPALTNSSGQAAASLFLSSAAGTYNLTLNYPGDGFYYLPITTTVAFSIVPASTQLQQPFAVALPTATAHVTLTMTDALGRNLQRQVIEPKIVYLELIRTHFLMLD